MNHDTWTKNLITIFCVMSVLFLAHAMNILLSMILALTFSVPWVILALALAAISGSAFFLSLALEQPENDTFMRNVWIFLAAAVLFMVVAIDLGEQQGIL